jgi:hypothetical protein
MAKHKSRATRAAEQAQQWRDIANNLRDIANEVDELPDPEDPNAGIGADSKIDEQKQALLERAQEHVGTFDSSELQSLAEEIGNWRDNMDSANMTHLPKYDEVSEAADTLEQIEPEAPSIDDVSEIDEAADELENRADELECVSFPRMF